MSSAKRLFLSCAPEDELLRTNLEKHLSPLERSGKAVIWHTGKLRGGDLILHTVEEQLRLADVILLLITPDFLASDVLHDAQLQPALARSEAEGARVVPILAKPCAWRTGVLARLEPLPKNRTPIIMWPYPDEAWTEVVNGLSEILEQPPVKSPVSAVGAHQVTPLKLQGTWIDVDSSSNYCIWTINGRIRCCYCYADQDYPTGEIYDCTLMTDTMFGRFRWLDNRVRGYVYLRFQSINEAIGGVVV